MSMSSEAKRKLDEFTRVMTKSHREAVRHAANVLQDKIKQTLNTPGRGRLYKSRGITRKLARKGTKLRNAQMHQASAPGDPPAKDIADLQRSVIINPQPNGTVRVGPTAKHATFMEYGTRHILPRPFMRRSLDAAELEMTELIISELKATYQEFAAKEGPKS